MVRLKGYGFRNKIPKRSVASGMVKFMRESKQSLRAYPAAVNPNGPRLPILASEGPFHGSRRLCDVELMGRES